MAKKSNAHLHSAKKAKNDEFYTRYIDIQNEVSNYKEHFKDKVVYCNCDDPLTSEFTKYFLMNFNFLGIKRLICTFYDVNNLQKAYAFDYSGQTIIEGKKLTIDVIEHISANKLYHTELLDDEGFDFNDKENCWKKDIYGAGDFRSKNCIEYLKQADIVVTNPPFSLFREYVAQLMEYGKKFLIIGNMNVITYKEIFPYIKNNELWLGATGIKDMSFKVPSYYEAKETRFWIDENGQHWRSLGNGCWFTNFTHRKRNEPIYLCYYYNLDKYPKYDNYDAIEVSKTEHIPEDYDGVMGVPITFLDKYCPTQFEILGIMSGAKGETFTNGNDGRAKFYLNGKGVYARILIRRKK